MILTSILIVLMLVPRLLACQIEIPEDDFFYLNPESGEWAVPNRTGPARHKDDLGNNLHHHGWTPSPEKERKEEGRLLKGKLTARKYGAGEGFDGADPPPWAYAPGLTSKLAICCLPPTTGTCFPLEDPNVDPSKYSPPRASTRFAYHPYKNECIQFQYSGCRGNMNNFRKEETCVKRCVDNVPYNGCDVESNVDIDDNL